MTFSHITTFWKLEKEEQKYMELKPCPFCGAQLEKVHNHYISIEGKEVDYDYYSHPFNGCLLEDRFEGVHILRECDIEKWNERVCL